LLGYRGWKQRVYRAIWNAVQSLWTAERWIRVTDDEGLGNWLSVNRLAIDPMTGIPTITNALGSLDVDIILDEGPDTVTMQADTNESVRQALQAVGPLLQPAVAAAALEVLIETSSMPASAKKKFRDATRQKPQPPDPREQQAAMLQQQAAMLELQGKALGNRKTEAETAKLMAEAQDIGAEREAEGLEQRIDAVERQDELMFRREEQDARRANRQLELAGRALQVQAAEVRARPGG
jgi:hypothetical protein